MRDEELATADDDDNVPVNDSLSGCSCATTPGPVDVGLLIVFVMAVGRRRLRYV